MQRKLFIFLFFLFSCTSLGAAISVGSDLPIKISGFADSVFSSNQDGDPDFSIHQFELGLAVVVSKNISFTGTLAYNATNDSFGAGVVFTKWVVASGQSRISFAFGKVDVPFGHSSGMYAAPDNQLINLPLANEKTIDGWNNIGLLATVAFSSFEIAAFVVDGSMELITAEDKGLAVGGRVQYAFGSAAVLGVSYALNEHAVAARHQFYNADLKVTVSDVECVLELQAHSSGKFMKGLDIGYMGQAKVGLKSLLQLPLSVVGRIGYYDPQSGSSETRLAGGLDFKLLKNFSLRTVFEHNSDADDTVTLQVLANF